MHERPAQRLTGHRVAAPVEEPLQSFGVDLSAQAELCGASTDPSAGFLAGGEVVVLASLGVSPVVVAPAACGLFPEAVHPGLPPRFPHQRGAGVSSLIRWLP